MNDIISNLDEPIIGIFGDAGSGKTMLQKHIVNEMNKLGKLNGVGLTIRGDMIGDFKEVPDFIIVEDYDCGNDKINDTIKNFNKSGATVFILSCDRFFGSDRWLNRVKDLCGVIFNSRNNPTYEFDAFVKKTNSICVIKI